MKLRFTLLSLAIGTACYAQDTIPNSSFENWTNQVTYETPDGWFSTNDFLGSAFNPDPVAKSTDAVDGTYSAKFINSQLGPYVVPGVATTGEIVLDGQYNPTFFGGAPYSKRPAEFLGKYKYTPGTNDTGWIAVTLTVYDTSLQMSVPVGGGMMDIIDPTGWTDFIVPITYSDTTHPDTLLIVIASSRLATGAAPASTVLFVDSLGFPPDSIPGGIVTPPFPNNGVAVFPNPSTNEVTIEVKSTDAADICIYDLNGALLDMVKLKDGRATVDLLGYRNGFYLYSIGAKDGRKLATGKFVVGR